jgi:hypothetical protein
VTRGRWVESILRDSAPFQQGVHPVRSSHFLCLTPHFSGPRNMIAHFASRIDPIVGWAAIGRRQGSDVRSQSSPGMLLRVAGCSRYTTQLLSQPHTALFVPLYLLFTLNVHTVRTQNSIPSLPPPPPPACVIHAAPAMPPIGLRRLGCGWVRAAFVW